MAVTTPAYGHGMEPLVVATIFIGMLGVALAAVAIVTAVRRSQPSSAVDDARLVEAVRLASAQAFASQGEQLVHLAEAKYGALHHRTDAVLEGHGRAVDQGLQHLADRLTRLEHERSTATTQLQTLVRELTHATEATRNETARLAAALSDNRVRGMWGEVQLRRALELAGLTRHVDFLEQRTVSGESGAGRPDVVVELPHGRAVVIDAKVPLDAYLGAAAATDPATEGELQRAHATAVSAHVNDLAGRDYPALVERSVDLVLMFLPGDAFLAAALDADAALFERAASKGVHLVTPTSLVPVLRGIALGWREHQAEQAAADIHALGVELHDRLALFAQHFDKVGAQLGRTVDSYNASVGSLERRVVPATRRLAEHGAASHRELAQPSRIDVTPRRVHAVAAELSGSTAAAPSSATSGAVLDIGAPAGTSAPSDGA